ncbi:MAG: transglycosylase SLT domain-containing protein [Proteobacteria bacterium]|nr:transglycosylase SLT domain-containing protein [Pseudomonadota bacterium]MBU1685841.1 transglycosylase SLT domain-containing protein [Pseudomonadota bacterium]
MWFHYLFPLHVVLRITCILLAAMLPVNGIASTDIFPVYEEIRPNVAFWEKIYAEYEFNQGVIHDKIDLGLIYEVITLNDSPDKNTERLNREIISEVKKKYQNILLSLAEGEEPAGPEEQWVAELLGEPRTSERYRNAAANIRFQRGQKDRFQQGLIRSGGYLEEIQRIFDEEGVPTELAYLGHVESSYNLKAYSKFGAAGIWQFTRATGKRFLTVDYTLDERRDPILSSRAAARLLKDNFEKLGAWPLAVTAYNHGAAGLARAHAEMGSYQRIFLEHRGRTFGFASRNFYSEFLAAKEVARNYQRYFGEISFDPPRAVQVFPLPGFVDVRQLAKWLELDLEIIREFNPALREPVFQGQKFIPRGYGLCLPDTLDRFAALNGDFPDHLIHEKQKPSQFYRVRRGDTVGEIARGHGIAMQDLLMANQLGANGLIYAGQNLRIPVVNPDLLFTGSSKSEVTSLTLAARAKPSDSVPADYADFARLQVAAANPEPVNVAEDTPDPVIPLEASGEMGAEGTPALVEPDPEPLVFPEPFAGSLMVEGLDNDNGLMVGFIRVEPGETLGHYGEWLEVPTSQVRKANGFNYGQEIRIDQRIRIPLAHVSRELFEERRYEYHKEIIEDFFAAYKVDELRTYTVKHGDNVWLLCRSEFDLPLWLVRKYNPAVNFNGLRPDQELLVPVVSKRSSDRLADLLTGDCFQGPG